MGALWFVTGGARSGKSRFAEQLATESGRAVVYVATMQPLDAELEARVARHRASRSPAWQTVEAPLDMLLALRSAPSEATVLIDCLSLWVSNHLLTLGETPDQASLDALGQRLDVVLDDVIATCDSREAPTVVVTNEVGSGVVPEYALGRAYRDLLGHANQHVSSAADRAWLLVAGRPIVLP